MNRPRIGLGRLARVAAVGTATATLALVGPSAHAATGVVGRMLPR